MLQNAPNGCLLSFWRVWQQTLEQVFESAKQADLLRKNNRGALLFFPPTQCLIVKYLSYFCVFRHHESEADVHQICATANTYYPSFQLIF